MPRVASRVAAFADMWAWCARRSTPPRRSSSRRSRRSAACKPTPNRAAATRSDRAQLYRMDAGYDWPRDHGYFPTPATLAKRMIERADIRIGMKVLEPSTGKSRIVWAAAQVIRPEQVAVVELLDANTEGLRKWFPMRCKVISSR